GWPAARPRRRPGSGGARTPGRGAARLRRRRKRRRPAPPRPPAASSAHEQHVQQKRQEEAEQEAGRDGNVEGEPLALHVDVAGEARQAAEQPQHRAEHGDGQPEPDQDAPERRDRHANNAPWLRWLRSGVGTPRWSHACGVTRRPPGVRVSSPIFNRNGSTISSRLSTSSLRVAASASIPTGPPLYTCTIVRSSSRSWAVSPRGSTPSNSSASRATSTVIRPWART